jgi:hypothetical protein
MSDHRPTSVSDTADHSPLSRLSATFGGVPVAVHDHMCAFYRGEGERDRLAADHLSEGLRAGDTCMYITTEGDRDKFRDTVGSGHPDVDLDLLDVRTPSSTYLHGGKFSPEGMLELIDDWSQATFEHKGWSSFARAAADMSWALPLISQRFVRTLHGYESRVAHWTKAYPQTAVCLYDLDRFRGNMIVAMIQSHPRTWISGVVVENPYFLPPSQDCAGPVGCRPG